MKILLDECIDEKVAGILNLLGNEADHVVSTLNRKGAHDIDLAEIARDYDVFVTLDLHRQLPEWIAVNRAMIDHGASVIRIKLPLGSKSVLLDTVRSLTHKFEEWRHKLEGEYCLITISNDGARIRANTREEVKAMLERRVGTVSTEVEEDPIE